VWFENMCMSHNFSTITLVTHFDTCTIVSTYAPSEYLTIQITFLQGLLNWLAAVVIDTALPKPTETRTARQMNRCMASWLVSLMLWMTAFYNNHLNFYSDYASMLCRYAVLFTERYVTCWPLRPMSFLYIPSFMGSVVLTWRAFGSGGDVGEGEGVE